MRFAWLAAHVLTASALVSSGAAAQGDDAKEPAPQHKTTPRRAKKPKANVAVASYPGFEMLPDGSSRVFVDVSKKIDVEEHVSPGAVTYVLKDAVVDTANDMNALETYYYPTPVVRARLREVKAAKKAGPEVDLYIVLRGDVKPTMAKTDQRDGSMRVEVTFPPGSYPTDGPPPPERHETKKSSKAGKGAKTSKKPGPQP